MVDHCEQEGEEGSAVIYYYPSLPFSDKDLKGKWLNFRAPVDPKHPNFYRPPKWHVEVDPDMSGVGASDRGNTDYSNLLPWFLAKTVGVKSEPKNWLLNLNYVCQEVILSAAGLSNIYDKGEIFFC